MIKEYEILIDKNNIPTLKILKEYDISEKCNSIHDIIEKIISTTNIKEYAMEHAYIIGFDANCNIKGISCISIGDSKSCDYNSKAIITFLILTGSELFITMHNHPNSDCTPSQSDRTSYQYLEKLAEYLEIKLEDNICVGSTDFYSMAENERYCLFEELIKESDDNVRNI